jgi:adenylate kinase family enzyme
MRRVLLIGPGGAGKSTLAKRLADSSGLPLVHLDSLFWKPGWRESSKDEWQRVIANLVQADAWIMDGNYGGTTDVRLAASDTVVLLDMPPALCLWRILKRWLRFRGQSRPSMARDCPERWSWPFVWWVLTYRRRILPELLVKLSEASAQGKNAVVLRSSKEVEAFCRQVHHVAQQPHAAIGSR